MGTVHNPSHQDIQIFRRGAGLRDANAVSRSEQGVPLRPLLLRARPMWNDANAEWRAGEFYKALSPKAISELELLAASHCIGRTAVLFAEEQESCNVLFLLEGSVKLTMNSSEGKRFTLGIAVPGDVLGLAAVVSGRPYETTAIAQFHCRIRALCRKSFLELLSHHPIAWQNSAHLLSVESKRRSEQLRILGLASTAPVKLAALLLQWCAQGQPAGLGVRIRCALTHEEIGEYVGLSRETVTRIFTEFRNQNLVHQQGSILFVPSLRALELYAASVVR